MLIHKQQCAPDESWVDGSVGREPRTLCWVSIELGCRRERRVSRRLDFHERNSCVVVVLLFRYWEWRLG